MTEEASVPRDVAEMKVIGTNPRVRTFSPKEKQGGNRRPTGFVLRLLVLTRRATPGALSEAGGSRATRPFPVRNLVLAQEPYLLRASEL